MGLQAFTMHSCAQGEREDALAHPKGMNEHIDKPVGLHNALMHSKVKGGALVHFKGMKENASSLCGVLMHSREGTILCGDEVRSRGKLGHFGCNFQF